MIMGGASWEVLFYIFIIASIFLATIFIPLYFLFRRLRVMVSFSMQLYGVGCIGHIGFFFSTIWNYINLGYFHFDVMFLWIVSGVLFLIISALGPLLNNKGFRIGYNYYFYSFLILAFLPTFIFFFWPGLLSKPHTGVCKLNCVTSLLKTHQLAYTPHQPP